MKKVEYEYGCRALGYYRGEMYVPEDMTRTEIEQKIKNEAGFSIGVCSMENGYEEVTEVVYKKTR